MASVIIRSVTDLDPFQNAWSALRPRTPFAGWLFTRAWLEHFREVAEPFVIVRTDGAGALEGVAPWTIVRGTSGARRLTGVGAGDAGYHDIAVRPGGDVARFGAEVLAALGESRRAWDVLNLTLRPAQSGPLVGGLERLPLAIATRIPWEQHLAIEFPAGWDAYWSEREKHFSDSKRSRRKLARVAHRFYVADPDEAPGALSDLFRLHAAHLAGQGDWSHLYAFLRAYCAAAVPRGEAIVCCLEIAGQRAAVDLLLRSGEHAYGFLRAFDPDHRDLAAGKLLTLWVLERLCREGVRVVDCGAGSHEWKSRFKTHEVATTCIQVPRSLAGVAALDRAQLRHFASGRFPWFRPLRPAMSPR